MSLRCTPLGTCALLLLACLSSPAALAQSHAHPSDTRPELPDFTPPEREVGHILPPLEIPSAPGTDALSGGRRVHVRDYRLVGVTVLSSSDLEPLLAPYRDRELSWAELEALRDRITLAYIERGYVTSGAIIPPQEIADGVVEIRVVEGVLREIEVETDGRFRPRVLQRQVERHARDPVNVRQLEEGLQLLQRDERIRSVDAQLLPGVQRGESKLQVKVHEERPWDLLLELNNHESPTIGGETGRVQAGFNNVLGFGDTLAGSYGLSEGLNEVEGEYRLPLGSRGTVLALNARKSWADVVEEPLDDLDIESRTWTTSATLHQSVWKDLNSGLDLFASFEVRRSHSFLGGHGFAFTPGPSVEGESKLSVIRLGQEWARRSRDRVLVLRTTLSKGIGAFNATSNSSGVADGRFFAWLVQAQLAQRLAWRDALLLVSFDTQQTHDPLLGLEQIAVGGAESVRGYRENTLVRDRALIGSVELRVPVLLHGDGRPLLELAAFSDAGYATNARGPRGEIDTLWSAGLGARVQLANGLLFEGYWGEDLEQEAPDPFEHDLQDSGFHFRVTKRFP